MDEDELLPEININEINLYPEMNANISDLLKIRSNDICSMYAAKLIGSLQKEIVELKARLDFIKKSSGDRFVPPENSPNPNRGED